MSRESPSQARLGVLLVEDNPMDARLLVESLRDAIGAGEVAVQTVRRMSDALRELRRFRFSCVLIDLGLPDGEGVAEVRRLRETDPRVAIVVLTGLEDPRVAGEARALGAQDYLVKGQYWGGELLQVIRRAVERSADLPIQAVATTTFAPAVPDIGYLPWVDGDRRRFCAVQAQWREPRAPRAFAATLEQWRELAAGLGSGVCLSIPAVEGFESAIAEARVEPCELRLSVSAAALIDDVALRDGLCRLRREGARIDLAGWRPGEAALEALALIPLDGLLIDANLGADAGDGAQRFLRASLAVAGALGLMVLVGGVAFAEQQTRLQALGCRFFSGPWFCPAQSAAELKGRWRKGPWGFDR